MSDDERLIRVTTTRLDRESCERILPQVTAVPPGEPILLVLDLEQVAYVSNEGAALIMQLHRLSKNAGHQLQVRNLQPPVEEKLHTLRLLDLLRGDDAQKTES